MDSLRDHGQVEPLIIQKSTGQLIAGHGRKTAMVALESTECDVVVLDVDDVKAEALALALNRMPELATWGTAKLVATLQAVKDMEISLDSVGFTDLEFENLVAQRTNEALDVKGKQYDESAAANVKYYECPACDHKWPR